MTPAGLVIERLDAAGAAGAVPALSRILIDCVEGGGGVSFLHPLAPEKSDQFWRGEVIPAVAAGNTALLVARADGEIVGTVQVILGMRENQPHRGEIAKLLVAPTARRKGVARALMEAAQHLAAASGKILLLLDTETGSNADQLYRSMGWQEVGIVPNFALTNHGVLCTVTYFYKGL
jgi:GNAT superfamily N-acetyltransferase